MNTISKMYESPKFAAAIERLYKNSEMEKTDLEFLLGCAILLAKEFDSVGDVKLFELAYNIILRYALRMNDYTPLYSFSCNYGFFPTVRKINQNDLLHKLSVENAILDYKLDEYKNEGYVETFEQNNTRKSVIASNGENIAYIAPTSYGKSSVIIQILKRNEDIKKAVVVVPSRALISQTYTELRTKITDRKFLFHEGMFKGEKLFVGALTQERLLRLIDKYDDLQIDCLFIDEAHRILTNDPRNIILSRVIKKCKERNNKTRIVYLSPFVEQTSNLIMGEINEIEEQRIIHNIKEPNYFVRDKKGVVKSFDRFSNKFYYLSQCANPFQYIKDHQHEKNFIFIRSPRKIEGFAEELYKNTTPIYENTKIVALQELLKSVVHPDFKIIKYLSNGILYLHANIPNQIKEYLLQQFKENDEIKYLVANVVITEGINLPIDCLFICDVHAMKSNDIQNLIGRVNRLNYIFDSNPSNLRKLMPDIHFVDVPNYTAKREIMDNALIRFNKKPSDLITNPLLSNYMPEGLNAKTKETNERIIKEEILYNAVPHSENEKIQHLLISSGMNTIVQIDEVNVDRIIKNMKDCSWDMDIIDCVSHVFTKDVTILDEAFMRLKNDSAVKFYKFFIVENKKGDLKSLIDLQIKYHMQRASKERDPYIYVGNKYGDTYGWRDTQKKQQKVYVNLREKSAVELTNLIIVKTCIEQEFLNYQYKRAVGFLYEAGYISTERFNEEIYGTNDVKKIELINLGLSMSLLNTLEKQSQIQNLYLDKFGNVSGDAELKRFRNQQNDFVKFEIDKYIRFE